MRTTIASIAVLTGAAFMFVAAVGVARLPDLYTRMHAATKPATVGVVAIMSGVALAFYELPVTARAALVALFFLLTAPVAAHAVARSAHARRVPLAPGTHVEDPPEHGRRTRGRGAALPSRRARNAAPGGSEIRERQQRPEHPAHEEERP